jgi:hypothetical protein
MRWTFLALAFSASALLLTTAGSIQGISARGVEGIRPADARTCPLSHPIKGNFTTSSGEPCIYHLPGGEFYDKTKAERCYATDSEARRDGCRKSKS